MTHGGQVPADAGERSTVETGTTTVGLKTADGVVIGTDMRASLGGRIVSNKHVQKVEQIHPTAAITMVGSVSGAQAYIRNLRAEVNLYEARRGFDMSMEALSTLAGNFALGGAFPINPILGGVDPDRNGRDESDDGSDPDRHHVYSIDPAGGVLEDDYVATGSGMQFALGVLEREYDKGLTNEAAVGVAADAVESAIERDTASGNGIWIAEITGEGVDIHGHETIDELR